MRGLSRLGQWSQKEQGSEWVLVPTLGALDSDSGSGAAGGKRKEVVNTTQEDRNHAQKHRQIEVLELCRAAPRVCLPVLLQKQVVCPGYWVDLPSGKAGFCGIGMQLGAEAKPPHTVLRGAKEVQGLLLQEKGVQRSIEGCPASSSV